MICEHIAAEQSHFDTLMPSALFGERRNCQLGRGSGHRKIDW
jgi:hypothetical protein